MISNNNINPNFPENHVTKRKRNDQTHHSWTEQERSTLMLAVMKHGRQWETIAREVFRGKLSPGQCAAQYNSLKSKGECNKIEQSLFDPVDHDEDEHSDDDDEYSEEMNSIRKEAHFKYGNICVVKGPIHHPHIYVTQKHKYLLWIKCPLVSYNFQYFRGIIKCQVIEDADSDEFLKSFFKKSS